MSLLLRRLWKLCHGKPAGATPPCFVLTVAPCGEDLGKLVIVKANEFLHH
ncbi:hypothetical protein F2Q68_00008085 [Brassica cretica]|uniref:Uncharacterized protein n=1 Tax=Brassica cretica TaxID=69181 RepID=A0A8S9KPN8_BRACR|nr:hypothetical protein F2Q68_00008085 [Brassica cretica]